MNGTEWLSVLWRLFLGPLVLSGALTALLIRWAPRLGLVDYPSERKVHTQPTPRGGGLAIFTAVSLVPLAATEISVIQWLLATAIVLLGLLDDLWSLRWQ